MAARHPYRRGDVVQFPFSGSAGQKDRPALVISTDPCHDEWNEVLVVAVTSRPPKRARPTDHAIQNWKSAGLHQASWVRSHLATVHRNLILTKLGGLSAADLQAVEQCLRLAMGL